MTVLFASSGLMLSWCTSTETEKPAVQKNPDIIEATGTITTTTGNDKTTSQIKTLIEKRKAELTTETGNEKELNEKDIKLLESILSEMTKKK